jgi:hypothetical protein
VAGAVVSATLPGAGLSGISGKALALSGLAVADSLSSALGVLVKASGLGGGVDPGKLVRAGAC